MKTFAGQTAPIVLLVALTLAPAQATDINPAAYPQLSDKELGHVRHMVRLANQPPGEWTDMGIAEPGQEGLDGYRYQLAFMSYALGVAHYHKTPAYRELYQRAIDQLIQKMLRRDVWGYWELTSKGTLGLNPALTQLGKGWIDPVVKANIMYSGHLFHMVSLYETLFQDHTYDQAGALTFVYDPPHRGMGRQEFVYDHTSLAEILFRQFADSGWMGVECELNAIFTTCNQHPILGFLHFDHTHGTEYAKTIGAKFKQRWLDRDGADPQTTAGLPFLYMVQQGQIVRKPAPWSDGWIGFFMHAWDKDYIEGLYPMQKEKYLIWLPDGTATVPPTPPHQKMEEATAPGTVSHQHAFMAVLASEVGDREATDALLAYADTYWNPTWKDGGLYYPRSDAVGTDRHHINRHVLRIAGNALLGFARINVKNGLWQLYNQPWHASHFANPFLSAVAYPQVLVTQAYYDQTKKALIITLVPGVETSSKTTFHINQLDPRKTHTLTKNGRQVGRLHNGHFQSAEEEDGTSIRWQAETGMLVIETAIETSQTFVIAERGQDGQRPPQEEESIVTGRKP